MKSFRLFDGDNQKLIGTYLDAEKQQIINKYEAQGFEISEDRDGDLVFFDETED